MSTLKNLPIIERLSVIARSSATVLPILMIHAQLIHAQPAALTVGAGYTVTVFAQGSGGLSAPDSIVAADNKIYIGYGDNHDPAGLDGLTSQIVEYSKTGKMLYVYNVPGHNDGLKLDPETGKLWAMQNEDGNPNLVIIDPRTREERLYTFAQTPPHGGGYDDIVFLNHHVYLSASNPADNPNQEPAIVEGKLEGNTIWVKPLLQGDAQAIDVVNGQSVTLNLQDPDSMTTDPFGDVLLDSQGDSELILVCQPGTESQTALQIPLSSPFGTPQLDDTLFIPPGDGFLLVADTPANVVYAIQRVQYVPDVAYSAGVGSRTNSAPNGVGFVGELNPETGCLTPVVSGF